MSQYRSQIAGAAPVRLDPVKNSLDEAAFVSLCVFIVFLEDPITLSSGVLISRWIGIATLGLVLLRAGSGSRRRGFRELHYWMMAFAVWSALTVFWTLDVQTTVTRAETYVQLLALAWMIWELARTEDRIAALLHSYVFGTSVFAVSTIANLVTGRTFGQTYAPDQLVDTDRYTSSGLNPNDLGLMLALSLPVILYLIQRPYRRPAMRFLLWCQFALAILGLLLSGSRGALLASIPSLAMFPITFVRLPGKQKSLAAGLAFLAAGAAIYTVPLATWQRFFRLGQDVSEGTMTHRTQIWAASMEVFRNHAFAGVGSGAHPVAIVSILGRPLVAHNTFISVLVELGVVGALLFLGLLAAAFSYAFRMTGVEQQFWFITLMSWCIGVCGATWEYHKTTWFLLSLLAAHAYKRYPVFTAPLHQRTAASACVELQDF